MTSPDMSQRTALVGAADNWIRFLDAVRSTVMTYNASSQGTNDPVELHVLGGRRFSLQRGENTLVVDGEGADIAFALTMRSRSGLGPQTLDEALEGFFFGSVNE